MVISFHFGPSKKTRLNKGFKNTVRLQYTPPFKCSFSKALPFIGFSHQCVVFSFLSTEDFKYNVQTSKLIMSQFVDLHSISLSIHFYYCIIKQPGFCRNFLDWLVFQRVFDI